MASMAEAGLDDTFDALTHPHRRYVLYYLRTHSEGISVDTLTAVLANKLEGPSATAGKKTPERIEIALLHTHLPKLANAGLITFDQNRRSVEFDGANGHGQFIDEAASIDGYAPPAAGD